MTKRIRRGNRVSPLWFFVAGVLLLIAGFALFADIIGDALPRTGAEERLGVSEDAANYDWRLIGGYVAAVLGVVCLIIWIVAFAVTVALVETNRRLERLDHLVNLDHNARQQQYGPSGQPPQRHDAGDLNIPS